LKLIVVVLLGIISVLAAACGGEEPTRPPATATAPLPLTRPPPTPTPTARLPGYTVSGVVLDSSNNLLLGGQVTLEPSGKSATTDVIDGSYQITSVADGAYKVSIIPQCVAYGCYTPQILEVSGSDVPEFHLAPVPASVLRSGPAAARFPPATGGGSLTLDRIEFPQDHLVLISPNDIQPGESAQIILAAPECLRCAALLPVDAPVAWSLDPAEGGGINPETGLLSIDAATSAGASFTVTAEVGDGQYSVSAEVNVYSAAGNPLVGVWRETHTGNINQLLLTSRGEFAVTLNPFEHYQDYWGTYIFELTTGGLATGFIELTVTGANQVAPDFQGTGTFAIDASGGLVFDGICFGGWDDSTRSPAMNCGHEFEK
jgi:hypothetical protein